MSHECVVGGLELWISRWKKRAYSNDSQDKSTCKMEIVLKLWNMMGRIEAEEKPSKIE